MGSACCVAARDRTITNGSSREVAQRNVRHSPSWSFQWENQGRVAGEETSISWSERVSRNDELEVKSGSTIETAYALEAGSSLDSFSGLTWQKSPNFERHAENLRPPASADQLKPASFPLEVKESTQSPAVSFTSPTKLSPSVHSFSSLSASPLSSQSHLLPAISTPSRWPRRSPGHQLLTQVSDSHVPRHKSPNFSISEDASSFAHPGWSNESSRGSNGGSSDSWSIPAFSQLVATSRRERWSFDSELFGFSRQKLARSSSRLPAPCIDMQTCGVCSKLLTEKSFWGGQKIIHTNELAVVSVLICGHVYHAECLESMTPEISKYDPACPVCTFGQRQVLKLSEKAFKAEMDLRARQKRSRSRVVNSDFDGDTTEFDRQRSSGQGGKSSKILSSSSMKSSSSRPFLRRHFSFGSKGTRSLLEHHPFQKKGFFWSKSTKE